VEGSLKVLIHHLHCENKKPLDINSALRFKYVFCDVIGLDVRLLLKQIL
jgi:hypothetical protein